MKKYYFLIIVALILGLVLTGCSLLSNISQVPANEQNGISYLTKALPSSDLVALWHFDGDTLDSSGNGNDGTLHNFVLPHGWVSGMLGQALSFDGVDDWVDIPDLSITGDFSIEFWVKLDSGIGNQDAIVGQEGSGQDINFYAGRCRWFTGGEDGFPWDAITANTPAQPNTWEYYAITRSGDTLTLYRNGVLDATSVISGIHNLPFKPKAIGRGNVYLGYFGGLIDEVRIWGSAFTAGPLNDITPPVITMLETSPVTIEVGDAYADDGATALDNYDGDLTGSIIVGGLPVNTAAVGTYIVTYDVTDSSGNAATQVTRTVNVIYHFEGFFRPIDSDVDVFNVVKAGRAIPVKFSLKGDQGLDIFVPGYPKLVNIIDCDSPDPSAIPIEETVTAGGSNLSYDATEGQYTYVWKTEKYWTGCRQLIVKLIDGTSHMAYFTFK